MTKTIDIAGLSLTERAEPDAPAPAAAEAVPGGPALGRRWADGAVSFAPVDPNTPWTMSQQWPNLVAAMSEQAEESSNLVLRALNYLVGVGRLRRGGAKALADAMHQLRATSLRAQQITRLAGGRIRQAHERLDLGEVVRHVLDERSPGLHAAGVEVATSLESVDVLLDAPVAFSLLNTLLDWGACLSRRLHLSVAATEWPGPARLSLRLGAPPAAPAAPTDGARRHRARRLNDGLHWMLLRQIAASANLEVTRSHEDGAAVLTIDFPKTFLSTDGVACLDLGSDAAASQRDTWVLVLGRDEALRTEAVEALRRMGIEATGVADGAQARDACTPSRPHVLVTAFDVPAEEVAALRREVLGGDARCPEVEITRDLPSFHLSGFDRFETPKVGREQVAAELPPTVLFELVKLV